ncbi:MAG: molybdopterin-dependent oxidoreductase [Myxococcota bacterium]|nr:molybdopterin-dependent oxidoreductase [Myxococcota bacterium]
MTRTQAVDPSVSRSPLPLDAADQPTVCVLCSHNCGLRVDVEDGRIAAVRADASNPITEGYVCNKAFRIARYVEHAQRVEHPLRRGAGGRLERVDWDTAVAEIAAKLGAIRDAHGPRAIGLVGIGGQANHMDAAYGMGFLGALGSRRWFNALAQEKTQHFWLDQWIADVSPGRFLHPDVERTEYLLVLGSNPRISNRGHNPNDTFRRLVEDPERRLVVVDPRETETTRGADAHLRVRPGTDAWLLLGMAAAIVSEGLADEAFLCDGTRDWEALREALAAVDVDEMAARCGVPAEDIVRTAREFARAERAAIFYDLAVEQIPFSTLVSYLIRVLLAITDNFARVGGNLFVGGFLPPEHEPIAEHEPERALASGIQAIRALGNPGMTSPTLVPEEVMIDHPERLRALVVEGANPILSYSDAPAWREAIERLDLLVVIEPAMTETARLADYVLPTPAGYEKWEIAHFPKRHPEVHVQLRPPVVPGPREALPEPEIYARLGEAMGILEPPPDELVRLAPDALTPEGAAAFFGVAMKRSGGSLASMIHWAYRALGPQLPAPSLAAIWAQCHLNAMKRPAEIVRTLGDAWRERGPFELAAEVFRRILAHPEGVEVLCTSDEDNFADNVQAPDGRLRLVPPHMLGEIARALATEPAADPAFPFVLASGLRTRWTANTIQRDPAWRKGRGPFCTLHLAPDDAEKLGLAGGDPVRVRTSRGAVELPAEIDPKLRAGHVWIPNGFGAAYPVDPANPDGELAVQGVNLNEITDARDRDPITGCPHHKAVPCQLERVAL